MIYNAQGKAVWNFHYTDIVDSRCPICNAKLVAKRYQRRVIWHWAHLPQNRADCPHYESRWHMLAKIAQSRIPGWVIEHPLDFGTKTYRVDAYHRPTDTVREFVHTATPYYYRKHLDLKELCRNRISWIFDGSQFVSKRTRSNHKDDGQREFLKERPFQLHEKIGGYVYWEGLLWKHWRNNVWYLFEHPDAERFLDAIVLTRKELEAHGTEQIVEVERLSRHPEHDGSSAVPPPSIAQSTN